MTIEQRIEKLRYLITCMKCEVSGKSCDINCPTQYDAGNMGEIIENLEEIAKILDITDELKIEPVKIKTVTVKQLEDMYCEYEKHLWREHEDVRGDDMVEVGTAEQLLQEELCLLGCWDDAESEVIND